MMTSTPPLPPGFPEDELLLRYFAGECAGDERAAVEAWVHVDASHAERLEELRLVWQYAVRDAVPGDLEAALAEFRRRRLGLEARLTRRRAMGRGLGVVQRPTWRRTTAALVAAAAVAAVWIIGWGRHSRQSETLTYVTANAQRANITLPDGNTVSLDVASRLDVPADYAAGNHTLRLSGAALFTVTHREGTPLTVVAGNTAARVLGTSFAVRRYPEDSTVSVAVREGRVGVHSTVVVAGEEAVVASSGAVQLRPAGTAPFSFATGVITLEGMPITDAIPRLDRWYDADIRLGDSVLARQRIGGSFGVGSLTDLQRLLELTFNVRVVRNGRVLTLFPR